MKKNTYLIIAKCLLNVMFYCGIPVTMLVPFVLKWYGEINSYYREYYWLQTELFLISGVFACLIVYELRRMIRSVEQENCFVMENVKSLKWMGNYSFIIAAATSIRLCLYATPGVFVVILVFVIAGLFSKVLAGVFEQAVNYKQENDLTI
ncbi:MAG: DUF2975 domain-containing protein [Lachnospiraceae bacterium]|nr:DUF2975 domain-containing protein [Lachnospiraceae bacterium]MDE6742946.1 DUF2975 domain-containing protein [Lachnospiraceae bacterium]